MLLYSIRKLLFIQILKALQGIRHLCRFHVFYCGLNVLYFTYGVVFACPHQVLVDYILRIKQSHTFAHASMKPLKNKIDKLKIISFLTNWILGM